MEVREFDFEYITCRCGKPGLEAPCPFQEEVHNKSAEEAICDCCNECRYQCMTDI